jgi:hypothetical protein
MNKDKFEQLSVAYTTGLKKAVDAEPEGYGLGMKLQNATTSEEYARIVSARMLERIASGHPYGISYDGGGWKNACKTLGIKHTRKAILTFLELESP